MDSDRRKELDLTTLDWPSNTPDLNKIEQCWSPMEDEISIYRFVGASMETVAQAKVISPLQLYSCANRQQATPTSVSWSSDIKATTANG